MRSVILPIAAGTVLLAASAWLAIAAPGAASAGPVDRHGQTAREFVRSTYLAMVENRYDEVRDRFNPPYLLYIERDSGSIEGFFEPKIGTWRADLLDVVAMSRQVRDDMPRVKAYQADGQGRPGVVNDLMLVDGRWTYVLWSNFQP